jgi:ABC-type multidrug transport system permease subunit
VRAGAVLAASLRRSLLERTRELPALGLRLLSLALGLLSLAFLGYFVDAGYNGALGAYAGHYALFLLIGVALLDLQNSVVSGLSRSIREAQLRGSLETLIATPTPLPLLLLALALPDVVWALGRLLLYALAGVVMFGLKLHTVSFLGVAAVLAASLAGFGALTLVGASLTLMMRRAAALSLLLAAASVVAGGVLYPRSILPHWVSWLSQILPITPALDALRAACVYDAAPWEPSVYLPLGRLGLFVLVVGPLGAWFFARRLSRARHEGSLTAY